MLSFIFRRFTSLMVSVLITVTVAFFILRILPGNAVIDSMRIAGASANRIEEVQRAMDLDRPLLEQYGRLLSDLLRGDFGLSLTSTRPVSQIMNEQLGSTMLLAIGGLVVASIGGLILGIIAERGHSTLAKRVAHVIATLSLSSPVYWTATLAIYIFSVQLRLFPSTGQGNRLQNLILPWLVLGLSAMGSIARVTAATLHENQQAPHVQTAYGKGLTESGILTRHILRNSIGPIISIIALNAGFMFGGTVITEMIFVRQGLGQILLRAITDRDFTVVQGVVIVITLIYGIATFIADLVIAIADPRLRFRNAN